MINHSEAADKLTEWFRSYEYGYTLEPFSELDNHRLRIIYLCLSTLAHEVHMEVHKRIERQLHSRPKDNQSEVESAGNL